MRSALLAAFASLALGCEASTPASTTPAAGETPVVALNAPPPAETAPKQAISGAKPPAEEAKPETSPEEAADDAKPAPSDGSHDKPGDKPYGVIGPLHDSSAFDTFGHGERGLTVVSGGGGQGIGGTAPARTPAVSIGLPVSKGSWDSRTPPEVIQRVVRSHTGEVRSCYEAGLRVNPALTGKVVVRFVIGRDGTVTSVANEGSQMPDPKVIACVQRAFSTFSFPQPEAGIESVSCPINFALRGTAHPAAASKTQAPQAPPPPPQTR